MSIIVPVTVIERGCKIRIVGRFTNCAPLSNFRLLMRDYNCYKDVVLDKFTLGDFVYSYVQKSFRSKIYYPFNQNSYGPSGENIIRIVLNTIIAHRPKRFDVSFVAPCIREESSFLIEKGKHLSLFFMLIAIYYGDNSYQRSVETLFNILGIKNRLTEVGIDIKNIRLHENIDKYIMRIGGFQPAKNFPYLGRGVEFSTELNCEVAHFSEVHHLNNGRHNCEFSCHIFGVGIERLLMSHYGLNDVWKTPQFSQYNLLGFSYAKLDFLRRIFFLGNKMDASGIDFSPIIINTKEARDIHNW